jgi:hypothetical protein
MSGARAGWSKGLTAATDPRIARMASSKRGMTNWARGLTAATDSRIAKGAATRRGVTRGPYNWTQPRRDCPVLPLSQDRGAAYAYVLGMYLGDGCLTRHRRTHLLVISLDAAYPDMAQRCAAAVRKVNPFHPVSIYRENNVLRVKSYGVCWLKVFPQHGPGRKHLRRIALSDWQETLVENNPWEFLRGLLESDGSRFDRSVGGRIYPAYGFTNRSGDILGMFKQVCDDLAIHYTVATSTSISIARRDDVRKLDEAIGPKR